MWTDHEMGIQTVTFTVVPAAAGIIKRLLGEEPGRGLSKDVISPLVTGALGIYRSKTV